MPSNHLGFLTPSDLLAGTRVAVVAEKVTTIAATFPPDVTALPCCLARTHVGLTVIGAAVVVRSAGRRFCLAAPAAWSALQVAAAFVIRIAGIISRIAQICAAFVVAAARKRGAASLVGRTGLAWH